MTYDEFWLSYLRGHGKRETRALHYCGSLLALLCLIGAAAWHWWLLIAAPLVGYAFAWGAHLGIEGNRPQTFGHPLWSLASDFRMLALWASGRLGPELARAGLA